MKRNSVLLGLFLSLSFFAKAQETKTLLYKISGNNIFPSYILGTMHLVPTADFVFPEKVKTALFESRQLVLELDVANPKMMAEAMKFMPMANDTTIYQLLDSAQVLRLDSMLLKETGMGIAMIQTFKPAIIGTFLLPKFFGENVVAYETELADLAQNAEIEILALETMAQQMQIFDAIPYRAQAEDLYEYVEDDGEMTALFDEMLKFYLSEDLPGLSQLMNEYFYDSPQEKEALLDARNDAWIPKLEKMMGSEPSFIAVGAGHLGGTRGVLAQLAALGYTVTPVY